MQEKLTTITFLKSLARGYSQVFFSRNLLFSGILVFVTFFDVYTGLYGLLSVLTANLVASLMRMSAYMIREGHYGFNALLVGLGLGINYEPCIELTLLIILGGIFTLFVTLLFQGILTKYGLPYLSIPFLFGVWTLLLSASQFDALGLSTRAIFKLNDLYMLGGNKLVQIYEWWNHLAIPRTLRIYFISLGAIFFQFSVFSGVIISIGILIYSRIAWTLSFLGFFSAYLFYTFIGADLTDLNYSYIGFNYILTAIAIGGYFVVPGIRSYVWVVILIPVVALVTVSLNGVLSIIGLPVYSLPFNIIVLLYLYALKYRTHPSEGLKEVYVQEFVPEKNLYNHFLNRKRFQGQGKHQLLLPFYGTWSVSQAFNGKYTHKDEWRYAWDFVILGRNDKQYKNEGNKHEDYFCYGRQILAPGPGTIETIQDQVKDNRVGEINLEENWGNTVIIKHDDHLYSKLSHLKKGSINVRAGDRVSTGQVLARCGNSGRSPYPHLHFQIQETPYIGSATRKYPVSFYILHGKDKSKFLSFGYPEENDRISRITSDKLLKEAFDFVPGRRLCFMFNTKGKSSRLTFEIHTDPYNQSYLHCAETGAMAYFVNTNNVFYFTKFKGPKSSGLYFFVNALYKVIQGYYQDLKITDSFPANLVHKTWKMTLHDFSAPFFTWLSAEYFSRHRNRDDEISPSRIQIESGTLKKVLGKLQLHFSFDIEIDRSGIHTIKETKHKSISLKRCKE